MAFRESDYEIKYHTEDPTTVPNEGSDQDEQTEIPAPIRSGNGFFSSAWVQRHFRWSRFFVWLLALICIACAFITYSVSSPAAFPTGTSIELRSGGLDSITAKLKEAHIIRYRTPLKLILKLTKRETAIQAGEYYFERPIGALSLAARLVGGRFNIRTVKISIPEGSTSFQIADIATKALDGSDPKAFKEAFLTAVGSNSIRATAKTSKEGYLFPDTYFVPTNIQPAELAKLLETNFTRQTGSLKEGILTSKRSLADIVTMASIVEEEGKTQYDRDVIAGILWHRLNIGMPLQVDAVFAYATGTRNKTSATLTKEDLTTDGPYNTYTRKGLPPTPISNPGLESLRSAIWPAGSPYLYYLSDKKGVMHYARTFEEHKKNREKYLGR